MSKTMNKTMIKAINKTKSTRPSLFFLLTPLLSLTLVSTLTPTPSSAANAKTSAPFQDVTYTFNQEKNDAAEDAFHFLRSYVDYFYLIIKANQSKLQAFNSLSGVSGLCVGDAHAENFGLMIQKDQTLLFTMNDMDDFGPCPVAYDLYRLMASSKLYNSQVSLSDILNSYQAGLKNDSISKPDSLKKMFNEGQKKGMSVSPKKISNDQIIRDSVMTEVSANEAQQITSALLQTQLGLDSNYKILDIVSTRKIGGGSGGLLRYEVLINSQDQRIHLELKEEITPSIYPVATEPIPAWSTRIKSAISMEQINPFSMYNTVQINNHTMLTRPRFWGNVGVALKDNSTSDNLEIINYEAYVLGTIHSRSVKDMESYKKMIKALSMKDLESDVQMMTDLFNLKFDQIKK